VGTTFDHGSDATLGGQPPAGQIFPIGEVLSDTYQIRGCLGEGGMSQVFEAQDLLLKRRVAIKASWPHADGPSLRKEAQALAVLRHPNLAVVHAFGTHRGIDYLVMERIWGVTLKEHLERRGALEIDEAIDILTALAQTLDAIHRAGVIHRDIKPANVMLSPGGRIVLVDFGIFAAEFELGQLPWIAGTPQYLAPELLRGQVKPGAGPLVDIYALGITAFEMLSGNPPFDDASARSLLMNQLQTPMPELTRPVPVHLARLIAAMTQKDPEARPQTMEEVLTALRHPAGARPTLLVVDDHPATLELLRDALGRALPELEIVLSACAEEAIAAVQRRPPHIITIDLDMPRMNGVELCLYLRGARLVPDAVLIVVSGHAKKAEVQLLAQLGVRHFIWKDRDYVTRVVATVREISRQRVVR
jgi:serine/threonine-protein kinase